MSTALPWVAEGTKQRCTLHDVVFAKTRTCPECPIGGPPIKLAREQLPKPPKGCLSTTAIEAWFVALAKDALKSADDVEERANEKHGQGILVATGEAVTVLLRDFHDETAIAKHRELAIKAMRAANELATRREDDEIVDIRDERRGGSH